MKKVALKIENAQQFLKENALLKIKPEIEEAKYTLLNNSGE